MCSATFGDEMWSTRGVGLARVMAAIRVRAGPTVKLVFENQSQYKKKRQLTTQQIQAKEKAQEAAQAKKDSLLVELEKDEKKIKIIEELTKAVVESIVSTPMNNIRKASEQGKPDIVEIASKLFDYKKQNQVD